MGLLWIYIVRKEMKLLWQGWLWAEGCHVGKPICEAVTKPMLLPLASFSYFSALENQSGCCHCYHQRNKKKKEMAMPKAGVTISMHICLFCRNTAPLSPPRTLCSRSIPSLWHPATAIHLQCWEALIWLPFSIFPKKGTCIACINCPSIGKTDQEV